MTKLALTTLNEHDTTAPNQSTDIDGSRSVPSYTMALRAVATSGAAEAVIDRLARSVIELKGKRINPSKEYFAAFGAIVADLLAAGDHNPPRPCYRPFASASFTGGAIGYDPFIRAITDLERQRYVEIDVGKPAFGDNAGVVTRIRATVRLFDALAKEGLTPANRRSHFHQPKPLPPRDPIRLRADNTRGAKGRKIRGERLAVDASDPIVAAMTAKMDKLNAIMADQKFSFGDGVTFYRSFNLGDQPGHGFKKGGRLYCSDGGYQFLPKGKRKAITINGLQTVEIDYSACHLTISHGLLGLSLPNRDDLYDADLVSHTPREVIKMLVTSTLGAGRLPTRWHPEHREEYDKVDKKRLQRDHPIKAVCDAVLSVIPGLQSAIDAGITWAELQNCESEIILDSIFRLAEEQGIIALPVHDSVIVPRVYKEIAVIYLSQCFYNKLGIYPRF